MLICDLCTGAHPTDTHLPTIMAQLEPQISEPLPPEPPVDAMQREVIRLINSVVGSKAPIQVLETPIEPDTWSWC